MDESTITPAGTAREAEGLPPALRPRPEDDERADRAARLVARGAGCARGPRLEPRVLEGARGLALALSGLALMRANGFAVPLAVELTARLEPVLREAEAGAEAVLPALAGARGTRRPRGSTTRRAGGSTDDAAAVAAPHRRTL
jgi:hypothetical protein